MFPFKNLFSRGRAFFRFHSHVSRISFQNFCQWFSASRGLEPFHVHFQMWVYTDVKVCILTSSCVCWSVFLDLTAGAQRSKITYLYTRLGLLMFLIEVYADVGVNVIRFSPRHGLLLGGKKKSYAVSNYVCWSVIFISKVQNHRLAHKLLWWVKITNLYSTQDQKARQ